MSDIPCALGLAQLETFNKEIDLRCKAGEYYNHLIINELSELQVEIANKIPPYCTRYNWQNFHLFFQFPLQLKIYKKIKFYYYFFSKFVQC